MEEGSPKELSLYIGIPTYGKPDSMFAIDSGWGLMFHIGRHHPDVKVHVHRDVRTYRQEARQAIVQGALDAGATHLLMLDDDHVFDGKVFDKLWENREKHMISALYMTRGLPCAPCIFRITGQGTVPIFYYPNDEVIDVDVVGFGFVLFNMDVFRRINPPWFNLSIGFGEDAAFCARLLQAGLSVACHTGAKVGHILEQPYVITEADYERTKGRISMATPELREVGRDNGGCKQGSKPSWHHSRSGWWKVPSARDWFYQRRRGSGTSEEERTRVLQLHGEDALTRGQEDEEAYAGVHGEETK